MLKHIRFISLVLVALVLVMFISGPAAAKVLKWKMTTSWPAGIPLYTDMAELYAKNVEKLSGGQIKIHVLPSGAISPALEVTDSVRKGIAESDIVGHFPHEFIASRTVGHGVSPEERQFSEKGLCNSAFRTIASVFLRHIPFDVRAISKYRDERVVFFPV